MLRSSAAELTGSDRIILLDPSQAVLRAIDLIGLCDDIDVASPPGPA